MENKKYDLFLFMGQSNMAGRGSTSKQWKECAPEVVEGAGYEYRAISDRGHLYQIEEPFGVNENNPEGIFEPKLKTGSMVTAFVNAYYKCTKTTVIGISASKGGSAINEWQGKGDYLEDAGERFRSAERYMKKNEMKIRHKYMLWCQGETDGDLGTLPEQYKENFKKMFFYMQNIGIETCFLVTIGKYNGKNGYDYSKIRRAQLEIVKECKGVELACDEFWKMRERGLMKDDFHYYQKAYNDVGTIAGNQVGRFVNLLEIK